MIRAISKIGELAGNRSVEPNSDPVESENAITVSQSHTATRVCCRAVTSVAQSPPSTSHLRRPASVVRWNNHLYRAAAVVPSKVLHHYLVHLASLSLTLPIASSVEALKVWMKVSTKNYLGIIVLKIILLRMNVLFLLRLTKVSHKLLVFGGKTDPTWRYVALQNINEKPHYQCLFCLSTFGGGGINRMKKYLAKIGGDIKKCSKVPYDVEK
ncbi:hypothetical protein Ahy_B03g063287 isoform B [Arachis hypogaea]|uniref:BED-type domain-containing protein n=1 Tax=Arachis hypogaea TaxID=3818 RepID=A0A444ZX78_ARAHY|nr:hypothetical protein Ahy_B03g063287 isoform B [Arachis hypogaea]